MNVLEREESQEEAFQRKNMMLLFRMDICTYSIFFSPQHFLLSTHCFPTTSFFCFFVLFFYCCFSSLLSFSPSSTSQKERFYAGKTYNNLESPICIRGVRGFSGLGSLSKLEKTEVCSFLNQSRYQYSSAHTSLTIAKESFLGL